MICSARTASFPAAPYTIFRWGTPPPAVSRQLATAEGEALMLLDETVYNQHGFPLHTSRQWIRGDKFTFRI